MSVPPLWFIIGMLALAIFMGFVMVNAGIMDSQCNERGGTLINSSQGYVCARLELL